MQQALWLDTDERVEGIPDIVLKVDDRPALVLDTKYKVLLGKPSNDDLNQMRAYCHQLGLKEGILIYPGVAPPDQFGLRSITVKVRSLDLDGDLGTFRSACRAFAEALHRTVLGQEASA